MRPRRGGGRGACRGAIAAERLTAVVTDGSAPAGCNCERNGSLRGDGDTLPPLPRRHRTGRKRFGSLASHRHRTRGRLRAFFSDPPGTELFFFSSVSGGTVMQSTTGPPHT